MLLVVALNAFAFRGMILWFCFRLLRIRRLAALISAVQPVDETLPTCVRARVRGDQIFYYQYKIRSFKDPENIKKEYI